MTSPNGNRTTNSSQRLLQFLVLATAYRSSVSVFSTASHPAFATSARSRHQSYTTPLFAIAEYPGKEDEKTNNNRGRNNERNGNDNDAWIETKGGFLPKIPGLLKEKLSKPRQRRSGIPEEVMTIQEYKAVVADEKEQMVVVRFYAPWCKACKAIEQPFRKLCRDNPLVKFVQCPVTKDNAYLHEGLGIPSLPYGHIYHPEVGLVEERKINKHLFSDFKDVLKTYIEGECAVEFPEGVVCVQASTSSSSEAEP